MMHTFEEIAFKMDALDMWSVMAKHVFALKPKGSVMPYFCTVVMNTDKDVRARLILLEGWETFQMFSHARLDMNFGFYTALVEMPHYAIIFTKSGKHELSRNDTGYMPQRIMNCPEQVMKMLWEVYGVMLRIESEEDLALKFAEDGAMFARIQGENGKWHDEALAIVQMRPYVESIAIAKSDIAKAKDLPIVADFVINVNFGLEDRIMTNEKRPRTAYRYFGADTKSGAEIFSIRTSLGHDCTLKGLWENLAPLLIKEFLRIGRIPAEVRVISGRVYRMLRPICMELPIKLSLHDRF